MWVVCLGLGFFLGGQGGVRVGSSSCKALILVLRLFSLTSTSPHSDVSLLFHSRESPGAAKAPERGCGGWAGAGRWPGWCMWKQIWLEADHGVLTDLVVFATALRQMPTPLEASSK